MADYIFIRRGRNILSSVLHVIFNVVLGVGSVAITLLTQSPILGIILVLISKWRIFAVRPRYWMLNIKSNLVDMIVGMSFVLISYCTGDVFLPAHAILAGLYTLWLIGVKPQSNLHFTEIQSLVAVFLGTTAVTLMAANADSIFFIAPCFLIGYAATRHVLVQSDDKDYAIVPVVAGLLAAELAWLLHSWLIVYSFNTVGIIIPQLSIVLTTVAFVFGYVYKSIIRNEGVLKVREVIMPVIFSIVLIMVMLIWFSEPIFNLIRRTYE